VARVRGHHGSTRRRTSLKSPPVSVAESPTLNRAEQISLERFSLGWPWNEAKNAAALACELIRWAMPAPVWVTADDPQVAALDARLGAETPVGDDPYRTSGDTRVNVDPPEVTDARFEIANILVLLHSYVNDEPVLTPPDFGEPTDHAMTRLYWYAGHVGKRAVAMTDRAAVVLQVTRSDNECGRWRAVGHAAQEACEFLRKHATNNPTVGAIDGAGGGILHRISLDLVYAGKPTEEITGRMFHWRVRDALKGRELSPELDANLRPAFEAAWSAAEYKFAYALLQDLDQIAELDANVP
jgi:hypothetical protein